MWNLRREELHRVKCAPKLIDDTNIPPFINVIKIFLH